MVLGVAGLDGARKLHDGRASAVRGEKVLEPVGEKVLAALSLAAEEQNQLGLVRHGGLLLKTDGNGGGVRKLFDDVLDLLEDEQVGVERSWQK